MTEYWLENKNEFQEVVLCFLRDNNRNNVVDRDMNIIVEQPQQENRDENIIVEHPQQENRDGNNNMVSNAHVSGVEGSEVDMEFGLQEDDDDSDMFDIDELPDFTHDQQQDQDMVSSLQGEGGLHEDDDKATQQQQYPQIALPPQYQDSGSINNKIVVMEDECVSQDHIFDLVDQQAGITQPQQQERVLDPYFDVFITT
ncbi:uncharacterized protein LOC18020761 [Eutrema salsugineum]|uniref:uncharacterized protein LOC18020761 n=1 Tax=Eutrema salsugineum TaxID=72664 RepID=UPI000CED6AC2|nr:uncharacterized protein LOC18020761 [Eutrema salsugineum]